MILYSIFFIIFSFAFIILSANYLIKYCEEFAIELNISKFTISVLIIAFGTSLPELLTSTISNINNYPNLLIGNIIGSNIVNSLIAIGFVAIIKDIQIDKEAKMNNHFMILVNLIFISLLIFYELNKITSIIFLLLFIYFNYKIYQNNDSKTKNNINYKNNNKINLNYKKLTKLFLKIILSLFILLYSSNYLIDHIVILGQKLNINHVILSLFVLAIGTSLPEITTSLIAVLKKKSDIAIGNIIGSNIFNILLIASVPILIRDIKINIYEWYINIIFLFISILLLGIIINYKKYIGKIDAIIMMVIFILFVIFN